MDSNGNSNNNFIDFCDFDNKKIENNNNVRGDNFKKIFILKKENEDYGHFLINIINSISTYSQLIELCTNDEKSIIENKDKIKSYSKEIKNNSEYLANLLKKMEIKEK